MDTLEGLKKKIKTASDLLSVVKTMKALAAVNIRSYEAALVSLGEYDRVVELGWRALFPYRGAMSRTGTGRIGVVLVIGSDQGMCGQFNEVAVQAALKLESELKADGIKPLFWSCGERAGNGLADLGRTPARRFELPGSIQNAAVRVEEIEQALTPPRMERGVEIFHVLNNSPTGTSGFIPGQRRVLPLDQEWLKAFKDDPWPGRCVPRTGEDPRPLFGGLLGQYFFISIFRALILSMAAENAARLAAMQSAEKNILELAEELQSRFRETRQNVITAELMDIIAGFEALEEKTDQKQEEKKRETI